MGYSYIIPTETAWIRRAVDLSGEAILLRSAADSRRRNPVGKSRHEPDFKAIDGAFMEPVRSRVGSTFNFVQMFEVSLSGNG